MAQGFDCLLDENQQLLLRIIQKCAHEQREQLSVTELKQDLAISSYQAKAACEQLAALSAKSKSLHFTYEPESGLTVGKVTTQTLEFLTVLLAKESQNLKILLNDGLGIGGSRANFLKTNGISQSTYYRAKHKMFSDLRRTLPDQKMESEIEKRVLLQHIIVFFFGSSPLIFQKLSKFLHNSINFLIFNWQLEPTYAEKKELINLIAVQLLRIRNKRAFLTADDDLLNKPDSQKFDRTKDYLKKNFGLSDSQAYHEVLFFNAYLTIFSLSPLAPLPLLKNHATVYQLCHQQTDSLEETLGITDSRTDFPIFWQELTQLNAQSLSPFFFINTFVPKKVIKQMTQSHPMISRIAHQFIDLRQKINQPELSASSAAQLFYQYLLLILNEFPATLLNDQVHIVADFTPGRIYNQFIKIQLEKLIAVNIVVDAKIDKRTDLFISDKYSSGIKAQQITWSCPPTAQDWVHLRSVINALHLKKAQK
ncbi:MAG TPA: hypothetical protein H9869_07040 [Candidatus Ligilactobacillus excrementipullorum]|nr:hypothetical protein [Candidatus Ligilactobacillus excrementipullorum]